MIIPCKTCLKYPICLSDRHSYMLIACQDLRKTFTAIYNTRRFIYNLDDVDLTANDMTKLYNETWHEIYKILPELERKMSYDSL